MRNKTKIAKEAAKKPRGKSKNVDMVITQVAPETVVHESFVAYSRRALFDYGSYVVEERAVPDFRDGLKPVQRRLIYSMYRLGLSSNTQRKKSARVVGDTLGLYHPHGDAAAYSALVGLANTSPEIVDGQGNWGSPVDNAASMRYTECRLTKFADMFLLDPGYMKVAVHEPNYDDTTTLPRYLPATLPLLLLIGNAGGVAYGVRACNPSFELDGVVELTKLAIKNGTVTEKQAFENLKVNAPFGSRCVSTHDSLVEFIKTGKASLKYAPRIVVNEKQKIVEIKSYCPGGFSSVEAIDKQAEKICKLPMVAKWGSDCGKKRKNAGPHGCYYYVTPKRGVSTDQLYDLADQIEKILTGSEYYALGITVRLEGKNKFAYCTYVKFMEQWAKYRLQLEQRYLDSLIEQGRKDLDRLELLLYAVKNRRQILAALQKALESKNPDEYLAKALKIDIARAKAILDLQVRRLAKLEEADLVNKIKELRTTIEGYIRDKKDPRKRIISSLDKSVNKYMKQ